MGISTYFEDMGTVLSSFFFQKLGSSISWGSFKRKHTLSRHNRRHLGPSWSQLRIYYEGKHIPKWLTTLKGCEREIAKKTLLVCKSGFGLTRVLVVQKHTIFLFPTKYFRCWVQLLTIADSKCMSKNMPKFLNILKHWECLDFELILRTI